MSKVLFFLVVATASLAAPSFDAELKYQEGIERMKQAAQIGGLTAKDAAEILQIFKSASDAGQASAKGWVGAIQWQMGNDAEAFKALSEAAKDSGNSGQSGILPYTLLGLLYYNGIGTEKNQQAAFDSWLNAANRGGGFAASKVGAMYAKGIAVSKNEEEALRWHERGSEPSSLEYLGDDALKKNLPTLAYTSYRKAGFSGDVDALVKYVKMSLVGETKNIDEAIHYSQVAMFLGSKEAGELFEKMKKDGLSESAGSIHRYVKITPQADAATIKGLDNDVKFLLRNSEVHLPDDRRQ